MDDFIWREPMEEKIIIMKEVTKVFENGEDYLKALNHVSFEICRDEFVVIMGTSGSGKTTLLNLLGGLETPTEGAVVVNGVAWESLRSGGSGGEGRKDSGDRGNTFCRKQPGSL